MTTQKALTRPRNSCVNSACKEFARYTAAVLISIVGVVTVASAGSAENKNNLHNHPSPYVRSHANDPIKWQPLTLHTLKRAAEDERPIFITSGYEACYWCHRLHKDTFQNQELAEKLNNNFIPIIIDREIHTAEDSYLQQFMGAVMQTGGWPSMTILTPEGDPVFGYSYTGPSTLSRSLDTFITYWGNSSTAIIADARRSASMLANADPASLRRLERHSTGAFLKAFLDQTGSAADYRNGGFGNGEKFPWIPQLIALINLMEINPQPEVIRFISLSVDRMLDSALVYQPDGSVFRYCTTPEWSEPHFEQMLYTQALMTRLLVRAGQLVGKPRYNNAAVGVARSMISNFRMADGWFRAARSAVSVDHQDGGYYLWSRDELASLFGQHWQMKIYDPGSGTEYVLPKLIDPRDLQTLETLAQAQLKRQPKTDDKALTGWNGLALSALASVASIDSQFLPAARNLSQRLLQLAGEHSIPYLANRTEDPNESDLASIVYLAAGLIDWWQLSGDQQFSETAMRLLQESFRQFFQDGSWRGNKDSLLGPENRQLALPDNQLPSPSGEWLRFAQLLSLVSTGNRVTLEPLIAQADQAATSLSMQQQAFFHGTTIAAKVIGKLLK